MIKISFDCDSSDTVALLTTFYDIIKEIPVEESNLIQDYGGYLFDFVLGAIEELHDYDDDDTVLPKLHRELIALYRKRSDEILSSDL